MKEEETIYANCTICSNNSGYDKESLKSSTWLINGVEVILCCPCEDELLMSFLKARGLSKKHIRGLVFNGLEEEDFEELYKGVGK